MKTNIKQTVGEKKRQESKNKHRGGNSEVTANTRRDNDKINS